MTWLLIFVSLLGKPEATLRLLFCDTDSRPVRERKKNSIARHHQPLLRLKHCFMVSVISYSRYHQRGASAVLMMSVRSPFPLPLHASRLFHALLILPRFSARPLAPAPVSPSLLLPFPKRSP